MAVAENVLLVAGAPDVVDPNDPLAAFEGRKGSVLCAFSASDGSPLWQRRIDALPVWDALAVAHGGLFLVLQQASVENGVGFCPTAAPAVLHTCQRG